jgi:hypothetical protein
MSLFIRMQGDGMQGKGKLEDVVWGGTPLGAPLIRVRQDIRDQHLFFSLFKHDGANIS